MTEKLQLYKCEICGNMVQIILNGVGNLVCCEKPMILQDVQHDKTAIGEKHAPHYLNEDGEMVITVDTHPMLKEHYIEFIEGYTEDKSELYLKYLKPEEKPEFNISRNVSKLETIDYCNIHGLWGDNKND